MLTHIKDDCDLFRNDSIVKKIMEGLISYQNKAKELQKSVLSFILESSAVEYRKDSANFYEQVLMLKTKLLESEILELYSKLYVRYHLEDLSNIYQDMDENQLLIASQHINYSASLSNIEFN